MIFSNGEVKKQGWHICYYSTNVLMSQDQIFLGFSRGFNEVEKLAYAVLRNPYRARLLRGVERSHQISINMFFIGAVTAARRGGRWRYSVEQRSTCDTLDVEGDKGTQLNALHTNTFIKVSDPEDGGDTYAGTSEEFALEVLSAQTSCEIFWRSR